MLENKLQVSSEIDSIFANSQMEPELRAPAGLLTSIIVLGLSTYTAYTAINEVREILKMPPGDARDKKLTLYAASEAGYIIVGALSGAAILRVFPKVAKIFSRGKIIVDSTRKLSNDGKIFFNQGKDLIVHYSKHSKGIKSSLGLNSLSTKQYIEHARRVLNDAPAKAGGLIPVG